MTSRSSVTDWIASLKAADAEAAQRIWERYASRLLELARCRLGHAPRTVADEEDVAQSVFRNVCDGAAKGRFGDINNRDDLWWLLLAITKHKVVDHIRRETAEKRGGDRVINETALWTSKIGSWEFSLDYLIGDEPTPDLLAQLDDEVSWLLNMLRDDRLRQIALERIEGYTVSEIATDLGISTRSVERKLNLIRLSWSQHLAAAHA